MKKRILFLTFLFFLSFALAQEVPDYRNLYVNDFVGILDAGQVDKLTELFYFIEQNTTAEIVFVSLSTIDDQDISQYALTLAENWEVGKADKDNGLVILYVADINKIWVATGYGLEGILPDSRIGRLLDENYVPLRDEGDVAGGIVAFSQTVAQVIYENKEEVISGKKAPKGSILVLIIFIIIFILIIISLARLSRTARGHGSFIPIFFPSGGGGGHSSGGGFGGGGSFGGGSFGGGGAGR